MDVELPSSGCNVITTNNTLYNYNGRTRKTYVIYEGQAVLYRSESAINPYSTDGYNCISTGDLHYYPAADVYFPFISFLLCGLAIYLVYKIIVKRLINGRS